MTGAATPASNLPGPPVAPGLVRGSPDAHRLACRLHRIEGQIRGIQHMVESGRGCVEVLTQIAAVHGALDGLAAQLVEQQIQRCILDATSAAGPPPDAALAEIAAAIGRLTRRP